ncbi:NAD-dependent DNA ligase LigA [Mycoplasma sp. 480]|uniref:NAD-dependent DNA ligase LigA n=1 Tax=Mycoplasma sp. 480 TaxID=3440155 RepID=UPI003F513E2B
MRKKTKDKIKGKTDLEIKKIIEDLRQEISYHDKLYFEENTQEISDLEYEDKMKELKELENVYFSLFSWEENLNSPTQKIHSISSTQFEKVKHSFAMLSLNKAYSYEEIQKFLNDSQEVIKEIKDFYIEPKIDGLSVALHYKDGKLIKALTRGNGIEGENIINNILKTKDEFFPKIIKYDKPIEIRGEIYIDKDDFIDLNSQIKAKIDEYNQQKIDEESSNSKIKSLERKNLFLNPRNAAAGIVRKLKNVSTDEMHKIKAFFYQVVEPINHNINSVSQTINFLKTNHFPVNTIGKTVHNLLEIQEIIEYVDKNRDDLKYEIDGMVIKVNDVIFSEELGYTSKFPKGAIAYKFYDEIVKTKLLSVDYQTGRTGKIAYVANLEPVFLNGTKVEKAYLHNFQNILNLKIRIGEDVYIKKSGEIIPQVISSVKKFENTNIDILTHCPSCNFPLHNTEKEQFCENENCSDKIVRKIIHFFSKNAFDVSTLSKKTIKQFYDFGVIKNVIDVFELEKNIALISANNKKWTKNFKMRSTTVLLKAINDSKTIEFSKFIYALGIKNIGVEASIEISKRINNIDELLNYDYEKFLEVNKFGETIVKELKNYFSIQANKEFLLKLKEQNLNFIKENNKIESKNLENISFVVTGTLSITRNEFKKLVVSNSGVLSNTITSKTNYLVVGDLPGESKLKLAEKHKTPIINEKEFYKLIEK